MVLMGSAGIAVETPTPARKALAFDFTREGMRRSWVAGGPALCDRRTPRGYWLALAWAGRGRPLLAMRAGSSATKAESPS
jgi:hypothetical protein